MFVLSHVVPSPVLFISCGLVHITVSLLFPFYLRLCRDMRLLTTVCILRNASLGDFFVVRTS